MALKFTLYFVIAYTVGCAQTITIGHQTWSASNLDITRFRNGDVIPLAQTEEAWNDAEFNERPVCCYYEFDSLNNHQYGKLYNWYAVNDKRGLAPIGWHVPADFEWEELANNLGGREVAGGKLKSAQGWQNGGNGSDDYGFAAYPGGVRVGAGFIQRGDLSAFWTSSHCKFPDYYAVLGLSVGFDSDKTTMDVWGSYKWEGMSLRCIAGEAIDLGYSFTAEIGGVMWSISNLNVEEFRNGDLIPEARTNEEWIAYGKSGQAAWCYYDNDSVNGEKFGKLYNWHAVHDPRGLAPSGWHIPTNEEWLGLNKSLGRNIGCKMKSTEGWRPNCMAFCKNELNSNSSGFTALPGGERWSNGTFKNMGCSGDWWSVSESKYAYWPNSEDGLKLSNDDSGCGYYVRCIRDDRFQ